MSSLRALMQGSLPVTAPLVLNPLMAKMVEAAGFPAGYLGGGGQRICYAFIDDVVEGHRLALERAAPGSRYILGGPNATYLELYALLAKLTGVPAPTRHLPFWAMGLAGRMLRWRAELTGIEPAITDEVIEIYRHDWAYASDRAVADLGYRITPLAAGLSCRA